MDKAVGGNNGFTVGVGRTANFGLNQMVGVPKNWSLHNTRNFADMNRPLVNLHANKRKRENY